MIRHGRTLVGIPLKDDQTISKLVLVSRDANLLRKDMGAQKCFQIQHLQGEEAWCLLKKIAGDFMEGDQLQPIAIKVLDECGGPTHCNCNDCNDIERCNCCCMEECLGRPEELCTNQYQRNGEKGMHMSAVELQPFGR